MSLLEVRQWIGRRLMPRRSATFALLIASSATGAEHVPVVDQTPESYERAVRSTSTSTSFIRVTLVDDRAGYQQLTCVNPQFVIGALMAAGANATQAMRAVLDSHDHVFHLQDVRARFGATRSVTDDDLARARELFASFSDDQLRQDFRLARMQGASLMGRDIPRAGRACALIERGLSPQVDDRTGALFVPAIDPSNTSTGGKSHE